MILIKARNVHQALPIALGMLYQEGVHRETRNGPVLMFPEPVTTVYEQPEERVLFWAQRDANPFFHLVESLWMLGGRNDVAYVTDYVKRMADFSDDGKVFHGAYGFRWREHFGIDQLSVITDALRKNPDDRRQVLSMWDAEADLGRVGKDLPCNLQTTFQVNVDGKLDMMVTNRSNDMVWGAYGANAVHFSMLHEYVARSIGREVGKYWQVSANFHAYLNTYEQVEELAALAPSMHGPGRSLEMRDPYLCGETSPFPIMNGSQAEWDVELGMFLNDPLRFSFNEPFFEMVAKPMYEAHEAYKRTKGGDRYDNALVCLEKVAASDWQMAAIEWIERRRAKASAKRERANDDGVTY